MYTTHIYICTKPATQTEAPSTHTNTNRTDGCILSPCLADQDEDPSVGNRHVCTMQITLVAELRCSVYPAAGSGCPVSPAAGT